MYKLIIYNFQYKNNFITINKIMSQTILLLPTLYNTTIGTNRSKQWSISVLDNGDNTFTIHTEHGITGGKQVSHDTLITEGKNKGKKNETTTQQQAILEAERDWAKKVKQGYAKQQQIQTQATAEEKPKNPKKEKTGRLLKPMLANEFDMEKEKSVSFPVFIQPKLDGVRCLIYKDDNDDKIIFQSRQNTIYEEFEHLLPELQHLMSQFSDQEGLILDGELYTHGMPFEKITSMVRSSKGKRKNIEELNYHIYDCFYSGDANLSKNQMPYSERYQVLKGAFGHTIYSKLILVETTIANSKRDIEDFHTHYTNLINPYEGVMIRTPSGSYKQQGRSKDLQKYKKFMDEEFEVVGHHEGTGAHAGTPIFECKSNVNQSKIFSVTMQGTLESKRGMLENVRNYYGKMLTVKYQEKSSEGIPRFPVGITFRDYE
jgi:DNA ligase-1